MGCGTPSHYPWSRASGTLTGQNWNVFQFSHTAGTIEG